MRQGLMLVRQRHARPRPLQVQQKAGREARSLDLQGHVSGEGKWSRDLLAATPPRACRRYGFFGLRSEKSTATTFNCIPCCATEASIEFE